MSDTKHRLHIRFKLLLIFLALCVVGISAAYTVYALTISHKTTVTPIAKAKTDKKPVIAVAVAKKPAAPTVTTPKVAPPVTPVTTTQVQTPAVQPAPVIVTPSAASQVPTLAPAPTTPSSSQSSSGNSGTSGSTTTPVSYQSTNWSGYMASGDSYTAISGSWIATTPTSTSASSDSLDGTWIGIGGVTNSDLIQVGTENSVSPSGVISTSAFYELLPATASTITTLIVQPGDAMSASITQTTTNVWTIVINDTTSGQTFSRSVSYASSLSSAEWIEEDPSYSNGRLAILDNFGLAQFSDSLMTADVVSTSITDKNSSLITMVNKVGTSVATPSALSGGSFSVQYQ